MAQKPSQGKKGPGCLVIALIVILVPILLFGGFFFFATSDLRRSDEEVLKTYQPSSEIAEIAEKNTLTDKGKAAFYRAQPEFIDGEVFRKYCRVNGVEALACVGPKRGGGPFGGRQIHLLIVDDPQFADHKYAAAVHEMLHAIYDRLSSSEKERINKLLEQELSKHQDDVHLTGPINILKKRGKANKDIDSELHSKFGVEYSELSPELEEYYKQYFVDRSKVVELFKNGGFNSRVQRMDEISYRMKALAPQITAYEQAGDAANYNRLVGQYNALAAESQGIYSEIKQFYQYFNPNYKLSEEKKTQ